MDVSSHLEQTLRQFATDAVRCGQAMRDLLAQDAWAFREAAVQSLDSFEEGAGYTCLLRLLGDADLIVPCLLEAASRDKVKLPQILSATQRIYPLFQVKLGDLLSRCPEQVRPEQERLFLQGFHLIEASSSKLINLRLLKRLLDSPNGRIRSKAARMLGQDSSSPYWLSEVLSDSDARVRANAIEALWHVDVPEVVGYYQHAAMDPVPRVAANALVGLYLAGKAEALAGIDAMARDEDAGRRASATWAMGRTGDRRFIAGLKRLIKDEHPLVRTNAIRAATRIRKAPGHLNPATAGDLVVVQATNGLIRFVLAVGANSLQPEIHPLDTSLEIDNNPVLNYSLEECKAPERKAVALLAPNLAARRLPLMESFSKATLARRPDDTWVVVPYAISGGSETAKPPGSRLAWLRDNTALQRVFCARGPIEDGSEGLFHTVLLCQQTLQKMKFERHAVLLVPDAETEAGSPELLAQIQELAAKEKITIHAVLGDEPSATATMIRDLCRATGGLTASSQIAAALDSLMRGLTAHHMLRYQATESAAGSAVLAVDSEYAVAKTELSLQPL